MEFDKTDVEYLEAQLAIGKAVLDSMLELIPKNGTEKSITPMTLNDSKFEVEVRMTNE